MSIRGDLITKNLTDEFDKLLDKKAYTSFLFTYVFRLFVPFIYKMDLLYILDEEWHTDNWEINIWNITTSYTFFYTTFIEILYIVLKSIPGCRIIFFTSERKALLNELLVKTNKKEFKKIKNGIQINESYIQFYDTTEFDSTMLSGNCFIFPEDISKEAYQEIHKKLIIRGNSFVCYGNFNSDIMKLLSSTYPNRVFDI